MSKLLLVFIVFLLVFKPQDLPSFVKFITKILTKLNKIKQCLVEEWYENLQKDVELEVRNKKAHKVDLLYGEKSKKPLDE